jgi:tRNA-specific adenosine deaminase 1
MEEQPLADLVGQILALFVSLPLQPPAQQYPVLASFCLTSSPNGPSKIMSLATGTKCLPVSKLTTDGESVHDSHAEVLARRAAVRWFLEEIGRCRRTDVIFRSEWICLCDDGRYALKPGVQLVLYVSTVPCEIMSQSSHTRSQRIPRRRRVHALLVRGAR